MLCCLVEACCCSKVFDCNGGESTFSFKEMLVFDSVLFPITPFVLEGINEIYKI